MSHGSLYRSEWAPHHVAALRYASETTQNGACLPRNTNLWWKTET